MKYVRSLPVQFLAAVLLTAILLMSFPGDARAQTWGAGTGSSNGTSNTVYVIPAGNGGTPVVEYLSATSDLAGTVVQFYSAGTPITVTGASSGTNIVAVGTGNVTAADKILLRAVGTDLYQLTTVGTVSSTNVTTLNTLTRSLAAGDVLYKLTAAGKLPLGAATVSVVGPAWVGDKGKPVAMVVTGTTNANINSVTFTYR